MKAEHEQEMRHRVMVVWWWQSPRENHAVKLIQAHSTFCTYFS
jgi:hypothetical protein